MTRPLAGYRVLEAPRADAPTIHRLALAMAGKIAADLGADVVKTTPREGDPLHAMPVLPWEKDKRPEAVRGFLDGSKAMAVLESGDMAITQQLYKDADIVLTDDDAPFVGKNVGAEQRQIVCVLKSFPDGSPLDGVRASELTLLALSGMLDIVGEPTREPLMLGGHQAAYAAGLALFAAMTSGVASLECHGTGDILDVDILDVLIWVNWKGVGASRFSEGSESTREGNNAEWQVVRTMDGWIALVFTPRNWPALVELIDDPLLRDPELKSRSGRAARRAEYMAVVETWCLARTREEIYRAAQKLRIPVGPVVEPSELLDDPQIVARQTVKTVSHAAGTSLSLPVIPVLWNGKTLDPAPAPNQWTAT